MTAQTSSAEPLLPRPVDLGGICGWLHGERGRGVVMCGAQGYEASATYQSWRILADLIAARGYRVLRFDLPGEGDSADPDEALNRIEAAQRAIGHAASLLKDWTGGTIDLVALRLGTLLAATAGTGTFEQVVLLAPVTRGRSHLRELSAAARLFASQPGREAVATDGGLSLCGHVLTEAEVSTLEKLDWQGVPARRTLAVLPEGWTPPAPAPDAVLPFEGYEAMMSAAEAVPPLVLFGRICDWLEQGAEALPTPALPAPVLASLSWRETRLRFGTGEALAGTFCVPQGPPPEVCVIMPNAGSNPRFGWARMAVDHARQLADAGIASLRFDLSGIGDSLWHPASARACLYGLPHLADMRAAIDLAAAQGYQRILLAGLCSGGYLSLHAAAGDPRVAGVVAVNVLKLIWRHGVDDLDTIEQNAPQASRVYASQAKSGAALKRLLSGEVSAKRLLAIGSMIFSRLALRMKERLGLEGPLPEETRQARTLVQTILDRGGQITFVHSELDASRDEADRHFGSDYRLLHHAPGVTVEIIPKSDHEMTPKQARDRLGLILADRARS